MTIQVMHYFYQKLTDKNITNKELLDLLKEVRTTLNLKEDELIVEEKLVTASYYRVLGKLVCIEVSENLQQTLSQIIPDYIPDLNSGNFVIDLAELADGSYRVIEYNCLNCSGLYSINPIKLVEAIFNE